MNHDWVKQRIKNVTQEALNVLDETLLTNSEVAVGVAMHLLSDVQHNRADYE